MTPGTRMVHPMHAFGALQSVEGGMATIRLDNGQTVESPIHEWEEVYIDHTEILCVDDMTDEELDKAIEKFRQMRVTGMTRRPRTRAVASQEEKEGFNVGDLAKLLEMAKSDMALAEALRNAGVELPKEE